MHGRAVGSWSEVFTRSLGIWRSLPRPVVQRQFGTFLLVELSEGMPRGTDVCSSRRPANRLMVRFVVRGMRIAGPTSVLPRELVERLTQLRTGDLTTMSCLSRWRQRERALGDEAA